MKIVFVLALVLTALLAVSVSSSPSDMAGTGAGSQLRILGSDDEVILLELTVDGFIAETVAHEGRTFHRLLIPDMEQASIPGAPQVPARGTLLGLPSSQGVSVRVVEADYETLHGLALLPAPGLVVPGDNLDASSGGGLRESFALDQDLYATDAFYPGKPVEIGQTGFLRDQAVTQVQFYPVQYNPVTGEVRLYRRVLARVTWEGSGLAEAAARRGASAVYERVLESTIANYATLSRPAVTELPRTMDLASSAVVNAATSTDTLKIGVSEDGLYQLTYDDLTGAGLDLNGVDPRTIKISNQGVEIPIYVHGEGDGVFTTTDAILFYGAAINDIYTNENIYWLTMDGDAGQRVDTRLGTPQVAQVPTHFPVTLHAEEDTYYWQTMPDGEGQDHWFWEGRLNPSSSRDVVLTLNNRSAAATTAGVRVRLKGGTDDLGADPDHHTRIYLNSVELDDGQWNGMSVYDHQVLNVPHALLNDGINTITVENVGDTGAGVDQVFVNWLEIDYWDTYVAEDDALLFGAPMTGTYQFEVSGFSGDQIEVFDVTDPNDVVLITDTTVFADGGGYTLQFEDTALPNTRYLALTPAQRKSPTSIKLDQPSAWKSPAHGADYVIITHEDFYASSLRLASHRAITTGLRVATVKVEDIYDEFNFGVFNPQAIRDFLSYAYDHWDAPAPTYVLLVGDAYQDYKDNTGTGTVNYVPSQIVETYLLGQTPSDNWFVSVSGDDVLPDMFIGRLSVQTATQADAVVDKIIGYDEHPPDDAWNTDVLLVADDNELSFEEISEQLADDLPFYYTTHKVYASAYPPGDPTTDISSIIDDGSILVNYTGHGTVDMWGLWGGGDHIFDLSDVNALTNTRLPVVTAANCLNGFFTGRASLVALAEAFTRLEGKGAVAVWAPTGLGLPPGHRALIREFYNAIFQDDQYAVGAATTAAKIAIYSESNFWGELIDTFVLFGDPATELGIPTDRELHSVFLPLVIRPD